MKPNIEINTIYGQMSVIYIPVDLGFDNPKQIAEALLSYKYDLSKNHIKVLDLMMQGKTNEQMAEIFENDVKTIQNWINSILFNMKAKNRAQASAIATKYGLGFEQKKK